MSLLKLDATRLFNCFGRLLKLPDYAVQTVISWTLTALGWSGNRSVDSIGTDDRPVYGGGTLTGTSDPLMITGTGILAGDTIEALDGGVNVPTNSGTGNIVFADGLVYGPFVVKRSNIIIARFYLSEKFGLRVINQFRGANALDNGLLSGTLPASQRGSSALYNNIVDNAGGYICDGINDYLDAGHTILADYGVIVPQDSENLTKALVWNDLGVQQDLQFTDDAKLSLEISEQAGYRSLSSNYVNLGSSNGNLNSSWSIIYDFRDCTIGAVYQTLFAKSDNSLSVGCYILYTSDATNLKFLCRTDGGAIVSLQLPASTVADINSGGEFRCNIDYNGATGLIRMRIGKHYVESTQSSLSFNSTEQLALQSYGGISRQVTVTNCQFAILNRNLTDSEFWDDNFVWGKSDEDFALEFSATDYECHDVVGGVTYPYLGTLTASNIEVCKVNKSTMFRNGFAPYTDGAIAPLSNTGTPIDRSPATVTATYAATTGINKLLGSVYRYSLPKSKRLLDSVPSFFTNGEQNKYTGTELGTQIGTEANASATITVNEITELKITE